MTSPAENPDPAAWVAALRGGDLAAVERWLGADPLLAARVIQIGPRRRQTPLSVLTDWPGYWPNAPALTRLLIQSGANPNVHAEPDQLGELPLHWAASSDDAEVAEALIEGGADIEARGGSIAEGSPLDNAVGYACWNVARLLVARGVRVERLWHAAGLGLLERLEALLGQLPPPSQEQVNQAFWHACAGGQRRAAELLLDRGADLAFVPDYAGKGTSVVDIAIAPDTRRGTLKDWLLARGAKPGARTS